MVVHGEADEGVGHLLRLRLGLVHPPVAGTGPHSVGGALDHLQVVRRGSAKQFLKIKIKYNEIFDIDIINLIFRSALELILNLQWSSFVIKMFINLMKNLEIKKWKILNKIYKTCSITCNINQLMHKPKRIKLLMVCYLVQIAIVIL